MCFSLKVLHRKHNNSNLQCTYMQMHTLRMFHVKQFVLQHRCTAGVKHKTSFFRVILQVVLLKNLVCCRVHIYVRYGWGVAVAWGAFVDVSIIILGFSGVNHWFYSINILIMYLQMLKIGQFLTCFCTVKEKVKIYVQS